MWWDGFLIAIVVYNVIRSAQRGGAAVGVELTAFSLTYAATLLLAPPLSAFVRRHSANPPPFLSFLSILAVFFAARYVLKTLQRRRLEELEGRRQWMFFEPDPGHASGACLGVVRGVVIAAAIAMFGCSLVRIQEAGYLAALPAAQESAAVHGANQLIDLMLLRYTHEAGPTTRELLDLALHPEEGKLERFLDGPFIDRLRHSEAVHEFTHDEEVKELVDAKRTREILTHPAFLKVLSVAFDELRSEEAAPVEITLGASFL